MPIISIVSTRSTAIWKHNKGRSSYCPFTSFATTKKNNNTWSGVMQRVISRLFGPGNLSLSRLSSTVVNTMTVLTTNTTKYKPQVKIGPSWTKPGITTQTPEEHRTNLLSTMLNCSCKLPDRKRERDTVSTWAQGIIYILFKREALSMIWVQLAMTPNGTLSVTKTERSSEATIFRLPVFHLSMSQWGCPT